MQYCLTWNCQACPFSWCPRRNVPLEKKKKKHRKICFRNTKSRGGGWFLLDCRAKARTEPVRCRRVHTDGRDVFRSCYACWNRVPVDLLLFAQDGSSNVRLPHAHLRGGHREGAGRLPRTPAARARSDPRGRAARCSCSSTGPRSRRAASRGCAPCTTAAAAGSGWSAVAVLPSTVSFQRFGLEKWAQTLRGLSF